MRLFSSPNQPQKNPQSGIKPVVKTNETRVETSVSKPLIYTNQTRRQTPPKTSVWLRIQDNGQARSLKSSEEKENMVGGKSERGRPPAGGKRGWGGKAMETGCDGGVAPTGPPRRAGAGAGPASPTGPGARAGWSARDTSLPGACPLPGHRVPLPQARGPQILPMEGIPTPEPPSQLPPHTPHPAPSLSSPPPLLCTPPAHAEGHPHNAPPPTHALP